MKFKYLLIVATSLYFNNIAAQLTFIPDNNFEQYLIDEGIDSDGTINGEVLTTDVAGVTILDIKDYNIVSFVGLKAFTSLTDFSLTSNLASSITGLSFGDNEQLNRIFILEAPNLGEIDIDGLINLTSLQVVTLGSDFYDINVDNNTKLTHLSLAYNSLEFLNVKNNVELTFLSLDGNPIGNIDISNNTKLETLFCRDCTLLTAVDLDNGLGSSVLKSVLLTGNPELLCVKVGDIAGADAETGWKKDATANYATDFGADIEVSFNCDYFDSDNVCIVSRDNYGSYNLDELSNPNANKMANKYALSKVRKRKRWRRSRSRKFRSSNPDEDGGVDFPNTGSGRFDYEFNYIVTNECGKEFIFPFRVEISISSDHNSTEDIFINKCEGTLITEDFLSSLLIKTNYLEESGGGGRWYANWNGEWIIVSDENFANSNSFKLVPNTSGDPDDTNNKVSTITISYVPCSVTYTFTNAKNTTEGSKDFYEVDILMESSLDFKLGSGKLYFNYNTEAFGENVVSNSKLEFTQPTGYILGEVYEYPGYKGFTQNDDTSSRFSISYTQGKSSSVITTDNITNTAKKLLHLKIEYKDITKSPEFFFETGSTFLEDTYTACGPYTEFGLPDCINLSGTQLTDITIENSGAVLAVSDELLAKGMQIYPNPITDNLTIDSKALITKVEIYSVLGNKVNEVNSGFESIPLQNLSKGIYLVRIIAENGSVVKKIVKQ